MSERDPDPQESPNAPDQWEDPGKPLEEGDVGSWRDPGKEESKGGRPDPETLDDALRRDRE